jgi:hypothetical protein
MDASGWSALCDRRRQARVEAAKAAGEDFEDDFLASLSDRSPAERAESSRILDLSHQIEAEQEAEDEEMMIRLIRIRRALWT